MTNKEMYKKFVSGNKKALTVMVTDSTGLFDDSFFENNMKFVIKNIEMNVDYLTVYFDVEAFKEHNRQYYTHNYYNNDVIPCLNVEEAGMFPKNGIEIMYIDFDGTNFHIISDYEVPLRQVFENETGGSWINGSNDVIKYVEWLENKLRGYSMSQDDDGTPEPKPHDGTDFWNTDVDHHFPKAIGQRVLCSSNYWGNGGVYIIVGLEPIRCLLASEIDFK
jgi:hypothetical protein